MMPNSFSDITGPLEDIYSPCFQRVSVQNLTVATKQQSTEPFHNLRQLNTIPGRKGRTLYAVMRPRRWSAQRRTQERSEDWVITEDRSRELGLEAQVEKGRKVRTGTQACVCVGGAVWGVYVCV